MTTREWIKRKLAGSVNAGIGRWVRGVTDPELGDAVFEFSNDEVSIRVHERGFWYSRESEQRWLYADIDSFDLMTLTELAALQANPDPIARIESTARFRIHGGEREALVEIPLKVYSTLGPTLDHIVDAGLAAE